MFLQQFRTIGRCARQTDRTGIGLDGCGLGFELLLEVGLGHCAASSGPPWWPPARRVRRPAPPAAALSEISTVNSLVVAFRPTAACLRQVGDPTDPARFLIPRTMVPNLASRFA